MLFTDIKLAPALQRAIHEQGYTIPTPIQQQAIPAVLSRRDLLGCAQTGTGKTAAFMLPLIQLLQENQELRHPHPKVLILAPTRELATQIGEEAAALGKYTNLGYAVIFGGVPQQPQVRKLAAGTDILIATPGRLKDLLSQGLLSLKHVRYLVLDEADRMLDMGFVHDVKQVIRQLPAQRQTLFFSATMPDTITSLANSLLTDPVRIAITPVSTSAETVQQYVYFAGKAEKPALLVDVLKGQVNGQVIVFTQMKHVADKISRILNRAGIASGAIHGNKSQRQRESALAGFKNSQIRVLVATDIAARGIDIDKLGYVINYDLPQTAETYVHRIGRTGRAGHSGTAISFCSAEEKPLFSDIQRLVKKQIEVIPVPATLPVLVSPVATAQQRPAMASVSGSRHRVAQPGSARNGRGRSNQSFDSRQRTPQHRHTV